ncbi:hypothetical protein X275_07685 [Marinitoga sp. 1197]|uniref:glycoside hydrolase family 3 N-terminal domain-containing protein n=1 Tax=Marinitoga sp. 1197 TaxID=1428449 RepID=UPI000640F045|nr:glycoside hydrolase family 3 N-terminal domain-containing protein [Marinitoga sp. 1197]KLO21934.1 hypothetical protein X275_07685 [Marinitoga sp. 1197]
MNYKYGKLFFLGFPGGIDDEALNIILKYKPAGIILYPGNMNSIEELQISMDKLYSLNIPLLISSDHEGGQLETVPGILSSPGNYAIGKTNEPNIAYKYAFYLGKKLKEFGFNMVFSPVLDVLHKDSSAVTGFRIFSDSPEKVSIFGTQYIKGLNDAGILSTAKHFPGHGKATHDSHEETPVIDNFSFNDYDLLPFENAIKNGVEMIMTAHIIYKNLDEDLGTVSKIILNDLLRKKLNYNGLIISDAIEMKAFYNNYFPDKGVELFFNNGGDILMIAEAKKNFKPIYTSFINLIENKKIDTESINLKIKKINEIQKKYFNENYEGKFLTDIAKKSLKINIKKDFHINLDTDKVSIVIPEPKNLSQADTTAKDLEKLESLLNLEFKNTNIFKYNPLNGETYSELPKNSKVISFVLDSFRFPEQYKLHKKIKSLNKDIIYVIIRNDQDETLYKDESYIITHSTKLISIYNAIKAIKKL